MLSVQCLDWIVTAVGFVAVFVCVICLSFPLSLTPSPPQLSLHSLHHLHVAVVQSLQSLSLLLHLVSPVCVCTGCAIVGVALFRHILVPCLVGLVSSLPLPLQLQFHTHFHLPLQLLHLVSSDLCTLTTQVG